MSGVSGKVMSTDVMNESHLKTTDVEKKVCYRGFV